MQTDPRTTRPRPSQRDPRYHHAIVIGGGIAGLATAAALARHVERVTIIEREELADDPTLRPGVPQAPHLQALLPGGCQAMERLFPGFERELEAAGATPIDMPSQMLWLSAAGWMPQFRARRRLLSATRELIEAVVRRLALASPAITLLAGHETCGLIADEYGDGVVGARVRPRERPTSVELRGDLVVDASGRRSHAIEWLATLGYPEPPVTVVDSGLRFATRLYQRPADATPCAAIMQGRGPDQGRSAVLFPVEGGRWMLTVAGVGGDHPPTDEVGFATFAAGMRDPLIHEFVTRAEPVTPIWEWSLTDSHRRHFESLERWPAGLVVAGDAACAINPVYGQGMSVALKTAMNFDERVATHRSTGKALAHAAAQLQHDVARSNAAAWMVSTCEDLKYDTTTGGRPTATDRLLGWYFTRVVQTATMDPTVNAAFVDVLGMMADPVTFLRPGLAARVLAPRRIQARPRPENALMDLLGARAIGEIDPGGNTVRSAVGLGEPPPAAAEDREPSSMSPFNKATSARGREWARAAQPLSSTSGSGSAVERSTLPRLPAIQRRAGPCVGRQYPLDAS